jgi:hypothetical protein
VQRLAGTYVPAENRIRDSVHMPGARILTFAPVLKYDSFPLAGLLKDLLALGRDGMGSAVEFEFSINLTGTALPKGTFNILQVRPMSAGGDRYDVAVTDDDIKRAVCYSTQALGHGRTQTMADIVFVKPDTFDPKDTVAIARSIATINRALLKDKRSYLLMGPGRWGSFDRWLGIPVKWRDIDAVGAIVEIRNDTLKADPSHGSHFFQNITANGIPYLTVTEGSADLIRWETLTALPIIFSNDYLTHVRIQRPLVLKCDGKRSKAVVLLNEDSAGIDNRSGFALCNDCP